MSMTEVLVALAILVGLIGILFPVLPGSILIAGAILVWALTIQTTAGWVVFAAALIILVVGNVIKYLIPGRQLKNTVPNLTLVVGALVAIIGFFVIPVVGLLVGFPVGVYLAERQRLGAEEAWPSTKAALKAVGLSILIELVAAILATMVWVGGLFAT